MSEEESEAVWCWLEGEGLLFGLESEDLAMSRVEEELVTWSGVEYEDLAMPGLGDLNLSWLGTLFSTSFIFSLALTSSDNRDSSLSICASASVYRCMASFS